MPMQNLHAPSVASSSARDHHNEERRETVTLSELMSRKENVEAELSALGSVLDSVSADRPREHRRD